MPPKFLESSFAFDERGAAPEHIEGYPDETARDPSKIWLEGEDTFEGELYPLAVDIDDLPTAQVLRAARLRHLEATQPSASSGGQSAFGIQDRVHIRQPRH